MDEFLAAARAEPGKITYGSSGIGNTTHVVGELFCRSAKVQLTHVPYKSTPITDAMAGTIDCFFVSPSLIMQYLQAGKLRMLGVSSAERMPQLPDVPTFGEYGIEADIPGWSGFWGPPKLPPALVDSLYQAILKARATSRSRPTRATMAAEIVGLPPAEFAAYVASEIERYSRCCRRSASRSTERRANKLQSVTARFLHSQVQWTATGHHRPAFLQYRMARP